MAGPQHLLRKSAIERMSSPEQLDMAMRVTSPVSWIALIALGCLVVAAVVFAIVGRIPVRVDGTGIIMRGDTVNTIAVTESGIVESIEVEVGDSVRKGQLVARLNLQDLELEIRKTEDRIAEYELQQRGDRSTLDSRLRDIQAELNALRKRRANVEELVEKRIRTRNDLLQIDAQINAKKAEIIREQRSRGSLDSQLAEQRRTLTALEEKFEKGSNIRSPLDGLISAILAPAGQPIRQGERLLNLEDPGAPFRVMLFVPFAEGKKVEPGMAVRISPSTVKPEEFGFINGTIEGVSSQAVSFQEVSGTLNNDQLARKFAQDTPFRVRATPNLDSATVSGFSWTSGSGPPLTISGNTPCIAQIIIDTRRPISYIIPTVKKALGAGA